jgi:hypothetical protein
MKFHIDTGGDHIETKLLVSLENVYLLWHLINCSFRHHILPLFVLQILVYKFTLKWIVPLLIKTFYLDISDKIR